MPYGGRGISVCDRWNKFENFLEDMGFKPSGMTIERINNDGDYEPSNCQWLTRSENSLKRNKKPFNMEKLEGMKTINFNLEEKENGKG